MKRVLFRIRLSLSWMASLAAACVVLGCVLGTLSDIRFGATLQGDGAGFVEVYFATLKAGIIPESDSVALFLPEGQSIEARESIISRPLGRIRFIVPKGSKEFSICGSSFYKKLSRPHNVLIKEVTASPDVSIAVADRCIHATLAGTNASSWIELSFDKSTLKGWRRAARIQRSISLLFFLLAISLGIRGLWLKRAVWTVLMLRVERRLPTAYLAVALPFGLLFMVLTPPGGVPDELAHVTKVVAVSTGVMLGDALDGKLPDIRRSFGAFDVNWFDRSLRFQRKHFAQAFETKLYCEPVISANVARSALGYAPFPYLIPAIIYRIGCVSDMSFGSFYYLSESANLVLALLLTFFGIRMAGSGRWVLFVVALLPMTVFLSASFSSDSTTLALSFLFIGTVWGVASGSVAASGRSIGIMVGVAWCIALTKPGYAWVLPLALTCWVPLKSGQRRLLVIGFAIVLPMIVHADLVLSQSGFVNPRAGIDPAQNWQAIVANPWHFFPLLANTFSGDNGWYLFRSMVGRLEWRDVTVSSTSTLIVAAGLLASLGTGVPRETMGPGLLARSYVVCLAIAGGSALSFPLYLAWTSLDWPFIQGLQGRYFLIVITALLLGFVGHSRFIRREACMLVVLFGGLYGLAAGALHLYSRYYGY